jgi:hypothetical protein
MTDQDLFAAIARYASERGVLPHRVATLVDLFRAKMTDEQLVTKAVAKALEGGCPSELLTNPKVIEAVCVRFGGDAPDAAVWLEGHGGDSCAMSWTPKHTSTDGPAT